MSDDSARDPVFRREPSRRFPRAARAQGARIFDDHGRSWLDAAGNVFVTSVGHGVTEVEDAIVAQLRRLVFAHTAYFASEAEERFASRLLSMAPPGFAKVWMCTSGAAANETAIKLARQFHLVRGERERVRLIARRQSYHGGTLGALSLTGQERRREPFAPHLLDVAHIPPPNCYRCPFGLTPPGCDLACADALGREIERGAPGAVSAFFVEAVAGGPLGALVVPDGYLRRVREICDRHGVLLVVDEIITAPGRTGRNFAVDHWGVVPDVITCAKGIAGGYLPIGAVLVHERIVAAFEGRGEAFRHGETFAGHALMAAAGEAVLAIVTRDGLVARAAALGEGLGRAMQALRRLPAVGEVRGIGLLWGVELVQDRATRAPYPRIAGVAEKVAADCFANGLMVVPGSGAADGVAGDTVVVAPPLTISAVEIDELTRILAESIVRATGAGAVSRRVP